MADIRLHKITVEQGPFVIQKGDVNITNTTLSNDIYSGALIINGGVSISNSSSSVSSSGGNSINIGGGIGVGLNVCVGGSYIQDSAFGTFSINGLSNKRLFIDTISNKNITIAPDGVNNRVSISDTDMNLNCSKNSTSSSIGALVINGGVSINTTADAQSTTNGGAITVGGGASILKKLYVGTGISSINSNTIGNIITTSGNVGINTTSPSNTLDVIGSISVSGNSTLGSLYVNSNNFNINNNTYIGSNVYGVSSGTLVSKFPYVLINQDSNYTYFKNFNNVLEVGYNNIPKFVIMTSGNIGINNTNPSVSLEVSGDIKVGNITSSNIYTQDIISQNITNTNMTTSNNVSTYITSGSIVSTTLYSLQTSSGNLNATNITGSNINCSNATISNIVSTNASITNNTISNIWSNNITSSNIISSNISSANINASSSILVSGASMLIGNSNTIGNIYTTGGNVGINNISPNARLDVSGSMNVSGLINFTNNTSNSLVISGGVSINNTANPTSLTVAGGVSIAKDVNIGLNITVGQNITGNTVSIISTSQSINMTTGCLIINGGASIKTTANSTSETSGGALTLGGGLAVGKDVYIAGGVKILSSVTSTNASSGSLVVYGGISVYNTSNSTSVSNGGAMTLGGGISISKDMYLNGISNMYSKSNYKVASDDIINFINSSNNKRFSINFNSSTNNFSIERYNTSGVLVEQSFDISSSTGVVRYYNTLGSTSVGVGAVVFDGGIAIKSTENSYSYTNGGCITASGGLAVGKKMFVGGDTRMSSTTTSVNPSSGAVIVEGGLGIYENLNVGGNVIINGTFTVNGTSTTLDSITTTLKDNIILLNSGPSGTKDSGVNIKRYQQDNNTGAGDVVSDKISIIDSIPLQTGVTSSQIKFSSSLSAVDNYYTGWWIKVSSGFSSNQVRKITSYIGSTKIATLSSTWTSQNPGIGDSIYMYNKPYVGMFFNELNDRFEMGSLLLDASDSVSLTNYSSLYLNDITCSSTDVSNSNTSGSIKTFGGVTILNTVDSSSVSAGGTFLTYGGASVSKTLYVGNELYVNGVRFTPNTYDIFTQVVFSASNNQSSFANISGFIFNAAVSGADIYLSAILTATSNLYTNYHIRIVNKSSSWEIVKTYVGDDMGLDFNVNSSGQMQYKSGNYPGFLSLSFKYRAIVN